MQLNIHLNFRGDCEDAFAHYEKAFGTTKQIALTYNESPFAGTVPDSWGHKIMHVVLPLGRAQLMGSDARPGGGNAAFAGFQVSIELESEDEVRRVLQLCWNEAAYKCHSSEHCSRPCLAVHGQVWRSLDDRHHHGRPTLRLTPAQCLRYSYRHKRSRANP